MICLALKSSQSFFVNRIQGKEKTFFSEKELFKEKWEWRIEQTTNRRLFSCFRYSDLKRPHSTLMNWKSARKLWGQQLNKI